MGNFFTSLFSSSKPAEATEDKAKNEQKNFDILKYDGVRAQKMGKLVYAIQMLYGGTEYTRRILRR